MNKPIMRELTPEELLMVSGGAADDEDANVGVGDEGDLDLQEDDEKDFAADQCKEGDTTINIEVNFDFGWFDDWLNSWSDGGEEVNPGEGSDHEDSGEVAP